MNGAQSRVHNEEEMEQQPVTFAELSLLPARMTYSTITLGIFTSLSTRKKKKKKELLVNY